MTTISLMTYDQMLLASQKPTVASGDVEATKIHIEFDAKWNNYPARSAVFHTSNNATVYEALIIDNECVIPHEVLSTPGTLYIGIRGISSDGEAVKTSTLLKYKILPGADRAALPTLEPTKDMYQQYIAAMRQNNDPVFTEITNKVDEYKSDTDYKLEEVNNALASKVEIKTGTYTGDGNAEQSIDVGFSPVAVLVVSASNIFSWSTNANSRFPNRAAFAISENSSSGITITDSGFTVEDNGDSILLNSSNYEYNYIAFKRG